PYKVTEMALSISNERKNAVDARTARDEAVKRLSDAYISIEQKVKTIEHLEKELGQLKPSEMMKKEAGTLESIKFKTEIACEEMKAAAESSKVTFIRSAAPSEEAQDLIHARNKLLAAFPIPDEAPNDVLKPIIIPTPYVNLYEFLASVPGVANYRVVHQLTTSWCPQREEHGYYLTPSFKCITDPRATTVHRWAPADLTSKMDKPTECFYNNDGVWYYTGVYKAFRLDDLTMKEWEALSVETTQDIVRETLEGRKNASPQNTYEVTQLYAIGALKVAVIALQCVGFNHSMYRLLLEHASKCTLSAADRNRREGEEETTLITKCKEFESLSWVC
ncbi:hypothetical protein BT96DRAFT_824268, partial [Gymnopus androsaceus JB14]